MTKKRPIYFRAKCLRDKSWVTGSYLHRSDGDYIVSGECRLAVDPDTICQLTGLKNGKGGDIWEGDILRTIGGNATCEVGYECGSFMAYSRGVKFMGYALYNKAKFSEVIGNKYDMN